LTLRSRQVKQPTYELVTDTLERDAWGEGGGPVLLRRGRLSWAMVEGSCVFGGGYVAVKVLWWLCNRAREGDVIGISTTDRRNWIYGTAAEGSLIVLVRCWEMRSVARVNSEVGEVSVLNPQRRKFILVDRLQ